jgi:hypothetical protein
MADDLTTTHMLYEGSFKEWFAHWEITCRVRTNNTVDLRGLRWFFDRDVITMKEIRDSISPYLLGRIPAAQLETKGNLYHNLKTASQPFRLMDLPVEVRLYIYRYVRLDLVVSPWSGKIGKIPPLLACCRQVRQEALPLVSIALYLRSEHLDIFDGEPPPSADGVVQRNSIYRDMIRFQELRERLRLWLVREGNTLVSQIRRLKIEYAQTCDSCDLVSFGLELFLVPGQGLVRGCCNGEICVRNDDSDLPWPDCYRNEEFMTDARLCDIDGALANFRLQRGKDTMSGEVLIMLIVDALPCWTFLQNDRRRRSAREQ